MNVQQISCITGRLPMRTSHLRSGKRLLSYTARKSSESNAKTVQSPSVDSSKVRNGSQESKPKVTESVAQADEELRQRLEQMSGEGGAAGIEYEDGKPTAMKRSVRNNMFRYI
ncbi:uncharacterized protein CDV56_100940 [Aspergillus thermomutatus]|uniref:Uncharacterized protein n=1 Tax=Aspergillus thermomutatus TaxID=41047 RepID=A0A397G835_ASPTH|nr:uncharacterized protein CDV56_100940 [Aspergillus thermomutatus]RHZ47165.1 hypothetical protein CDV56_100940 [Aspergillus thermomutatus]